MKKVCQISTFVIFIIIPFLVQAQKAPSKPIFQPYWEAQLNGGITQYFGDLNQDDFFNKSVKPGFGGIIGYQFSPVLGARSQFLIAKLMSDQKEKQLKFNADLWDVSAQLSANINALFAGYNPDRLANVYLFWGAGLTSHKSTLTDYSGGTDVDSTASRKSEFFLPVGLGISFRLSEKASIVVEYGEHFTFKDKSLDLYSASRIHDHYGYASAGFSFKFGGPRDMDKDGVKDKVDKCPTIPGKLELSGCPDNDNDGITDAEDECPDIEGKAEFKGCPDTDNDGIPDKDDKCPRAAGKKELNGCPDKDNDGIIDSEDKCPDVAGKKEMGGCPDKDGDGVVDKDDLCPEVAGLLKFSGCPDTDKDGVPDNKDKCPEVAGSASNQGCPEEEKALVNDVVHFNTDDYIMIGTYNQLLNTVIETLRDNPGAKIVVDGHTDARESENYNMKLSEQRADYVIKFFTDHGIDPARITKRFFGETMPIGDNSTEEGMALNRRVEIKSTK